MENGRNPDLGEHLWQGGSGRNLKVMVTGVRPGIIAEAPRRTRDVSFHVTLGTDRYCGTLNTKQRFQTLLSLYESGDPLMVEGRLAPGLVKGKGGESFRLIHGVLKPGPQL